MELPWRLGPPDGRYLIRRDAEGAGRTPSHVLVLATLAARERRRLIPTSKQRKAQPEPEPAPVDTGRATIIDVGDPLADAERADAWLTRAGESELAEGLVVLNRALHAHRLAATDPLAHGVRREDALVARVGYGAGEEVADGLWTDARELVDPGPRRHRRRIPLAQGRFAALLTGRRTALTCEELVLRARLDLDDQREREAALQLRIALDAALAELPSDPVAPALEGRLRELRDLHAGVATAAESALRGPLAAPEREGVEFALGRIEAVLRARDAALKD